MYVDETVLDNVGRIEAADTTGLLPHVASAARQVRHSWTLADEAGVDGLRADGRPRALVVVGIGGSAQAAGVLDAVAGSAGTVPVVPHADYGLPGWVGVTDVVLAVSSSGRSAETVSAVEEARRRGCRLVVVSPADTPCAHLAALARAPFIVVPETRPAGTALWSLAAPLLAAGRALGALRVPPAAVEAAAVRLEEMATRCRPSSESFVNPAKMLALELAGSIPVVWGTSRLTAMIAARAVAQLAATAGYPAIAGALPHPARDQIAMFDGVFGRGTVSQGPANGGGGTEDLDDFFRDRVDEEQATRLRLVLLRDPGAEHPEVTRSAESSVSIAAERGIGVTELRTEGAGSLERLASLIGLVDFAAVYLALALGADPGRVLAVAELDRHPSDRRG